MNSREPNENSTPRWRVVPISLETTDYELPADREAKAKLDVLADLKNLCSYFVKEVAEPWITANLSADSLKISKRQFPDIGALISEIATILNVPNPDAYIQQNPVPNAFTHGTGTRSFLVLSHSLVEQLSARELSFVIGHEMGHIKSNHVVYTTLVH